MLVSHKIIDSLYGRGPYKIAAPSLSQAFLKEYITLVRGSIEHAEKFDFGQLLLEKTEQNSHYKLPSLTHDEEMFWAEGLIPLPAEFVWYEFIIGNSRSGMLITEEENKWTFVRIDITNNDVYLDGLMVTADRSSMNVLSKSLYQAEIKGDENLIKQNLAFFQQDCASNVQLGIYLTLMLNSKSTDNKAVPAEDRLNRHRFKAGLSLLEAHRVVRIVPLAARNQAAANDPGFMSERRSPRLHWRRSHLRTLEDGRRIVIPRFMVGRAELGEVTHEYRFVKD